MKQILYFTVLFLIFTYGCQSNEFSHKIPGDTNDRNDSIKEVKRIPLQEETNYKKVKDIPVPDGYKRIKLDSNSIGSYLRNLDLKQENNTVYLFDGSKKWNQESQFAIIKMDVGTRDLQQCADAVMRLRAEYLFKQKEYDKIHFNFVSDGQPRYYTSYAENDRSYKKFRKYMDYIFSYANTKSLHDELLAIDMNEILPGDILIQTGNPYGHAVTVMDVAINETGEKIYMLSQSYMPAQEIYILVNPHNKIISPWYKVNNSDEGIFTPEWPFTINDLRRFKD